MYKKLLVVFVLIMLLASTACQPVANNGDQEEGTVATEGDTTEVEESEGEEQEDTETEVVSEEETSSEEAEVEEEIGPADGGTLIYGIHAEPETLDMHLTSLSVSSLIGSYFGATLISVDPLTDEFVPWVAESWESSEDGMAWTFHLRDDVLFHDGTPVTAEDFVYTINRALDPETMSPTAGTLLMGVMSASAVDEYTLEIQMAYPNYSFMKGLSTSYIQVMPQAVVEADPDQFAIAPVGAGPFIFKEWVRGDHITLVRNPDYSWTPEWAENSAPYLDEIVFKVIPEYATRIAGLEAGEIDIADVQVLDVELIKDTNNFQIIEGVEQGAHNVIYMNHTKEIFGSLAIRQALNMAVDRSIFIEIIGGGYGENQYGPLSPSVQGYWEGVKDIGYEYDPEGAIAILEEAGWLDNDGDGVREKDGELLSFELVMPASSEVKFAELLQEQFAKIGIEISIRSLDLGVLMETMATGNYDLGIMGIGWSNAQLLWAMFHTNLIGAYNLSLYSNPDLDAILDRILIATTQEEYIQAAMEAQEFIVEEALLIPTITATYFTALNNRVQGIVISPFDSSIHLDNAYIVK